MAELLSDQIKERDMRKYYYSVGGARVGPVTLGELKLVNGLSPETLIWYEGLPSWVRAGDLPDLHEVVPIPAPSEETEEKDDTDLKILGNIIIIIVVLIVIGPFAYSKWESKKKSYNKEYYAPSYSPSPAVQRKPSRLTTSELARKVQQSIIETYSEKGRYISVADDLILLHTEGNEYMGAMVIWEDGEKEELIVYVSYDGNRFEWYSL